MEPSRELNGSLEDTLRGLKIIQAVNEGNQVRLQELLTVRGTLEVDYMTRHGTPLHLSANMNNEHIMSYLVENQANVNARDAEGNSPLHRAVKASSLKAIEFLLKLETVDLFMENDKGQVPSVLTNNRFILDRLNQSWEDRAQRLADKMLQYARSNNTVALQDLFKNEKLMALMSINRQDFEGNTLLHYAALNGNASLIVWALSQNANVHIKNNGKQTPIDLVKNNETLRRMLKEHATVPDRGMLPPTTSSSTMAAALKGTMQGYLYKWTNYKGMYRKRYFDLNNGCLSYAMNESEVKSALRGVLRLQHATISPDMRDRCQFVVRASSGDKYFIRADNEAEREKWIIALRAAKVISEEGDNSETNLVNGLLSNISITSTDTLNYQHHHHHEPSETRDDTVQGSKVSGVDEQLMSDEGHQKLVFKINSLKLQSAALGNLLEKILTELKSKIAGNNELDASVVVYEEFRNSLTLLLNDLMETMEAREKKLIRKLYKEMNSRDEIIEMARELLNQRPDLLSQIVPHPTAEKLMKIELEEELARQRQDTSDSDLEMESLNVNLTDRTPRDWNAMSEEFFDAEDGTEECIVATPTSTISTMTDNINKATPPQLARRLSLTKFVGYSTKHRVTLPSPRQCGDISLWGIIRNCIGKDFTKVSMSLPIELNEPISMLQRIAEDLTYSTLLDMASENCATSLERIQYIAAYAMTTYSATIGRKAKPFNPLLQETFELIMPDRGFRYIAEQVSHRPPVSACFCESDNYSCFSDSGIISKLAFTSMSINLVGRMHAVLKKHGEHYSWNKVTTYVSNLTQPSSLKTYHEGEMVIINHLTNEKVIMHFHPQGKREEDSYHVTGIVYDAAGKKRYLLRGRWNDKLISEPLDDEQSTLNVKAPRMTQAESSELHSTHPQQQQQRHSTPLLKKRLLWQMNVPQENSGDYYGFCPFTFRLNEINDELRKFLPRTDSRLRPDQRAMEDGDLKNATCLKTALEVSQRARRKHRLEKGLEEEPSPLWFEQSMDEDSGIPCWKYTGKYWDARKRQQWKDSPAIFEIPK